MVWQELGSLDGPGFANVEAQIYAAAKQAAYRPDSAPPGGMREIVERDGNGNTKIRFIGETSFVTDPAYGHQPGRRVRKWGPATDYYGRPCPS
jgi:hypothetical protein